MIEFYTHCLGIDLWKDLDTKSGKTTFLFWFNNHSYESSSEVEARKLINELIVLKQLNELERV